MGCLGAVIMVTVLALGVGACVLWFVRETTGHVDVANAFIDDVRETGTSDRICPGSEIRDLDVLATSDSQRLQSSHVTNDRGTVGGTVTMQGQQWQVEVYTDELDGQLCVTGFAAQPS